MACRKGRRRKRAFRRQESRLLPASLIQAMGWPAERAPSQAIFSPAKVTPFAGELEPSRSVGLPKGPQALSANKLGELCLQAAHAPQLLGEAPLDLPQFALQVHLLPLLQHRAFLLSEPLLLDARPVGHRGEEGLVLMRQTRAQLLDVRVTRIRGLRQLLAGAGELHGE